MPEQVPSAAAMIRRFRQSRPTSRAERVLDRKKNNEPSEVWWVQGKQIQNDKEDKSKSHHDDHLEGSEPKPRSSARPIPSKPSNRADLLSNLNKKAQKNASPTRSSVSSIPVRVRSSLAPRERERDPPLRTVDKLRDSMEVDDWIENEIRSLEAELSRNKADKGNTSRSTSREKDRPLQSYRYADEEGLSSFTNNNNNNRKNPFLEQSRISFNNSGKWLRGSNDTLGSIKGLLDMDLRFDSKAKDAVSQPSKPKNNHNHLEREYMPSILENDSNGNLHDVNHDLETLLATLKKEQAELPHPRDLDNPSSEALAAAAGVDLTISQISNQLSANMLAFQAAFGVRDEIHHIKDEERKVFEERIREEGRKEERERRLLDIASDDYSHSNHQHQVEMIEEDADAALHDVDVESKPRILASKPPLKDIRRGPIIPIHVKPSAMNPNAEYKDAAMTRPMMMPEPMMRDTMFIQSALDSEFIAMSQAMKQMQQYRHRLNQRMQSMQLEPPLDDESLFSFDPPPAPYHQLYPTTMEQQPRHADEQSNSLWLKGHRAGLENPLTQLYQQHHHHHAQPSKVVHENITAAASDIHDLLESAIADLQEKFPSSDAAREAIAPDASSSSFNPMIAGMSKSLFGADSKPSEEMKSSSSPKARSKVIEDRIVHDAAVKIVADSTAAAMRQESLMFEYSDDDEPHFQPPPAYVDTTGKKDEASRPDATVAAATNHRPLKVAPFATGSSKDASAGVAKIVNSAKIPPSSTVPGHWEPLPLLPKEKAKNPIISELNQFDRVLGADRDTVASGVNPFQNPATREQRAPWPSSTMAPHDTREKMIEYQPSHKKIYEASIRKEFEESTGRNLPPPRPSAPPAPAIDPYTHADRLRYPAQGNLHVHGMNNALESDRNSYQYPSYHTCRVNQPVEGLALQHVRSQQVSRPGYNTVTSHGDAYTNSTPMNIAALPQTPALAAPSIDATYHDRERYLRQMQQLRNRIVS